MTKIPEHLLAAQDVAGLASDNDIARARTLATELVTTDRKIAEREAEIKDLKERRNQIAMRELPDLFAEIGIDRVGLPDADVDVVAKPYYMANIAASWEPERREAAFDYLEEIGHGDVIKTTVSVAMPRGSLEEARAIESLIRQNTNYPVNLEMTVPWNSLTSLLREQVEAGEVIDLDKIGATVGRTVDIKKRKK